jgi:hypothetical protein
MTKETKDIEGESTTKIDKNNDHENVNEYEYHVKSLKIDKVSGNMQIGHLINDEAIVKKGIHRIYIDEIKIHEVEKTGTVGLGITEKKDKKKKKKKSKITPEEASQEVKVIYDEIKQFLNEEQAPLIFQKIAVKENVLKEVWEFLKEEKKFGETIHSFYLAASKELEKMEIKYSFADLVDKEYCNKLSDKIEKQIKTTYLVGYLLESFLPGYVSKISNQPKSLALLPKQEEPKDILSEIKNRYKLKQLPDIVSELGDDPDILTIIYFNTWKPLAQNEQDQKIYQYFVKFVYNRVKLTEFNPLYSLSEDEQSFLFLQLINHFGELTKYIVIEYQVYKTLCKRKEGLNQYYNFI